MNTKELLQAGFEEMQIAVEENILDKFINYKELLQQWNQKVNLTAITEDKDIVIKHFLDSATLIGEIDIKTGAKIIDIGTGAGFPGIPIKLLKENTDVLLMDSLNKRIIFLDEVIKELDLKGIKPMHMRAEDAGRDDRFRAKFDICVSRAVARLSVLCEYCLPLVKKGGEFIAMKGPDVTEEISEARSAIEALGGEISDVKTVLLPFSDIKHTLIVIKKLRQTSKKYPRTSAQISKIPIE